MVVGRHQIAAEFFKSQFFFIYQLRCQYDQEISCKYLTAFAQLNYVTTGRVMQRYYIYIFL